MMLLTRGFLLVFWIGLMNKAGAAEFTVRTIDSNGSKYQVADIDLKTTDLNLYWKNAQGTPYELLTTLRSDLRAQGKTFLMATNSGIYAKDMTPLGLHVENGKELRPFNKPPKDKKHAPHGNFYLIPNGVFALTEKKGPIVMESEAFDKLKPKVIAATQSGPLLVQDNKFHVAFNEKSENKNIRSGVGVNNSGHVIFAISEGAITFYEFAQLFRDALKCTNALYLDGTISSVLLRDAPPDLQVKPFVGIWAATEK
jgi:uncharacterized protein YigE (DUF2233 family)